MPVQERGIFYKLKESVSCGSDSSTHLGVITAVICNYLLVT